MDQTRTKVLLDGSCWRYRYGPTFDVGTMATASWAPPGPLTADAPEQLVGIGETA